MIRATNPESTVIIGLGFWNNIGFLPQLDLPEDDRHIIAMIPTLLCMTSTAIAGLSPFFRH